MIFDAVFIVILILNLLIAVGIIILGCYQRKGVRCVFVTYGVLCIFCPLVLELFLGISLLIERIFRARGVDLQDISFDKTREKMSIKPDDRAEMNYVPISDALQLSDLPDLRRLLIDILKYDPSSNIRSIADAINSDDTEASHYAASAIQDALNEFRNTTQKLTVQLQRYPDDVEINLAALKYVYNGLILRIMADTEQRSYIYSEDAIAENLYTHNMWFMTARHYSWMVELMISIGDFSNADKCLERAMSCRPDELDTYKARLRLLYSEGRRKEFFECINSFKSTNIEADQEMLDMIRLYQ